MWSVSTQDSRIASDRRMAQEGVCADASRPTSDGAVLFLPTDGRHQVDRIGDNGTSTMTDQERATLAAEIASAVGLVARQPSCKCAEPDAPVPVRGTDLNGLHESVDLFPLRLDCSRSEIEDFLSVALTSAYRSVCVPPRWAALAVRCLADRPTRIGSMVGLPVGASLTPTKCAEAECLLRLGIDDLWMVADMAGLRTRDLDAVFVDIRAVAHLAECRGAQLNAVLEFPLLDLRQKAEACVVARLAGADAVVSSSNVGGAVADIADIDLMCRTIGGELDVVAAGGIRTLTDAGRMLDAGATRVVASIELAASFSLIH